ncbi:MAG: hypothetical protein JNN00_03770 [Chitinophagaceae bacterium]|nr:hypothetical protein [Chitinophagaceae bacterium]
MKQIFFCLTAAFVLAACNNEKKTDTAGGETKTDKPAVTLPYTASYSSSFEMGNPEYSATILQGSWKDWEENKLDNMKNWIADTITAFHSDNSMVKGADSLAARWKRARAGYTSVIDTIEAVIPVYSTDKKENWVLVWAMEINTKTDGTKDTVALMETWRINKDGKADFLLQYDRAKRKK